jgi:ABC-type multidrug transport system fused ATPase/permease subunit
MSADIGKIHNLRRALSLFTRKDKKKLYVVVIVQIGLGVLDLLGVALIGVLGSVAVNGLNSSEAGSRVQTFLSILNIENLEFRKQAMLLAILAASALLARTFLSLLISNRIIRFLGYRAALLSSELIHRLLSSDILTINKSGTQRTIYSVSKGVNLIIVAIISVFISMLADVALLVILFSGLFVINPIMATCCLIFFGGVGLTLYTLMQGKAKKFGNSETNFEIATYEKMLEILSTFRQAKVGNKRSYYVNKISEMRMKQAAQSTKRNVLPNISKYIIDAAIVVGGFFFGVYAFTQEDASLAVGTLSVFIAAGSRIAPAVLRIQQGALQIRGGLGLASPTLDLFSELLAVRHISLEMTELATEHAGFSGDISASNLSYKYPDAESETITNLTFEAEHGSSIAIVGPSGAGKSTLVDLLLGMLTPSSGSVTISKNLPQECFARWPGAVAYVPQESFLSKGTIRENICQGYDPAEVPDELIDAAIEMAGLRGFVDSNPDGLDHAVGEIGNLISGGEAQRIGIARALLTRPALLVLDEATSSLDSMTEEVVTNAIRSLKGSTTLVVVAHRLSTVRDADLVIYLEGGRVIAQGSFEKVRQIAPDFDRQAKLMGL